jgi:hypothetical protein
MPFDYYVFYSIGGEASACMCLFACLTWPPCPASAVFPVNENVEIQTRHVPLKDQSQLLYL